jgi:hypothetical protein
MADNLFQELKDEYTKLKSYRENFVESRMRDSVQLVVPKYGVFGSDTKWPDIRFDTIGTECAWLRAKGFFGNMSPSAAPWFRYQYADPEVNKDKSRLQTLEHFTEHMIGVFNRSTYYRVGPEWFLIATCLPASVMDIRENKEDGTILCTVEHPRGCYIKTNSRNEVVGVYSRRFLTAEQAAGEFGEDKLDNDLKAEIGGSSSTEHEFVDVCRLRKDWKPGSKINTDWKWGEYTFYLGSTSKTMYFEGGTQEFPKAVLREGLRGSEPYAYTPIDDAMPDIRTCNQMARTMLDMKNKQAAPARWRPEEGRAWSSRPDSINYYKDPNRREYKDEIGNYVFDQQAHEFFHQRVRKALNVDAFLMLMQIEGQMTAREVVERKREGMAVTSSDLGGAQKELDHIHRRFIQIEQEAGRLNDFAEIMDGSEIKVEYLGLLAQQQKQVYIEQGIVSALQTESLVFTLWPNEKYRIKPAVLTEDIWRANGAPEDALASEKEYQAIMDEIAKQQQQQIQAAMAQQMMAKADPMQAPEQGSPAAAMMGG